MSLIPHTREKAAEPWKRFTLLDGVLLLIALGAGVTLAHCWREIERRTTGSWRSWPADAAVVEVVIVGLVIGGVLAGPMVLGAQVALRRRRTRLSAGEWLWIAPIALDLLARPLSHLGPPTPAWFLLFVLGQMVCSSLAVVVMCARLTGQWGSVPYPWTELAGCVACSSAGVLMIYALMVDPLRI